MTPTLLLPGTLDLLVLKAVSLEPLHGYGVLRRIEQLSGSRLQVPQGSLYPALHRLVQQGWLTTKWGVSQNNRRAKYYHLTADGVARLAAETQRWKSVARGVDLVLAQESAP